MRHTDISSSQDFQILWKMKIDTDMQSLVIKKIFWLFQLIDKCFFLQSSQ